MALGLPRLWPPCACVHSGCAHRRDQHLSLPPKTRLLGALGNGRRHARDFGQRTVMTPAMSQETQDPLPRLLRAETPINCTPARAPLSVLPASPSHPAGRVGAAHRALPCGGRWSGGLGVAEGVFQGPITAARGSAVSLHSSCHLRAMLLSAHPL